MTPDQPSNEISFRDLFQFLRRGLLPALIFGVALAVAAFLVSRTFDPVYRARASVLASQLGNDLGQFGASLATAPVVDVSAYRTAALSSPVVSAALRDLGVADPGLREIQNFRSSVTIRTEDQRFSALLHIDVEQGDPTRAAAAANALATQLIAWDQQRATRGLERITATLQSQLEALDAQIRSQQVAQASESEIAPLLTLRETQRQQLLTAQTLETGAIGLLEIVEPALAPLEPVAPRPALNGTLAFVLGVFLTYGLLLVLQALDTRIRDSDDLAATTGQPVLAEFPKLPGDQRRLPREAVRYLRTNLLFATADSHPKVILVTSAGAAEGKTSVALSLAESFARNDHRTLLVDADLRKPMVAKVLGLNVTVPALADYLQDPVLALETATVPLENHDPLHVVPTLGTPATPTELLGRGIKEWLESAKRDYDVIVIDSAPLLPVADSLTVAPHVTGTVMVASVQNADRRRVRSALGLLERMGVRILGIVATQIPQSAGRGSEGYGYGYGYGESKAELRS